MVRDRLQALQEAFDGWLDRVAKRVEPTADRFAARRDTIERWFGQERPRAQRMLIDLLHLLYRLAKSAVLVLVAGAFFLFVIPIVIVLVLAAATIVLSPLILVYVAAWLLLGALGVGGESTRLIVLGVITFLTIRIGRLVHQARGGGSS